MTSSSTLFALDVGGARVGVARGDTVVKIATPLTTLVVDGTEYEQLKRLIEVEGHVAVLVVGYPRNQSGQPTDQTRVVEKFAEKLQDFGIPIVFQDESLTSVIAEQRLKERNKHYTKEAIDAEAAAIILQDYLELQYGH